MTIGDAAWIAYFFVVGSCVGSFLNVCIWRLPRRCLSVFRPFRSFCPSCKSPIQWQDNVPVLSYIVLRGRCRTCRARIHPRYVIVEIVTGITFGFLFYLHIIRAGVPGWSLLGVHLLYASGIIAASFIDWEWMIIPDRLSKPGMALAPILGMAFPRIYGDALLEIPAFAFLPTALAASDHVRGLLTAGVGMALGAGAIYGMGVFGKVLFQKEAMGFGDVKYMAAIGGVLGWQGVAVAIVIACALGSVVGIIRRVATGDSYIPFGPFLGAGAVAVMAEGKSLIAWAHWRFGEVIRGMADRLGHGLVLAILLAAAVASLGLLVRSARRRAS